MARFRNKLFEQGNVVELGQALRNSMDVHIELNDILRAAEGDASIGAGESLPSAP